MQNNINIPASRYKPADFVGKRLLKVKDGGYHLYRLSVSPSPNENTFTITATAVGISLVKTGTAESQVGAVSEYLDLETVRQLRRPSHWYYRCRCDLVLFPDATKHTLPAGGIAVQT